MDGYEEGSSEEIEEDYGEDYYDELSEEEVHERRHPPAPGPPLPPVSLYRLLFNSRFPHCGGQLHY